MATSINDINKVAKKLEQKGVKLACSRCGFPKFELLTGDSIIVLDKKVDGNIEKSERQVVIVRCSNCGAITMHDLAILGMSNENNKK